MISISGVFAVTFSVVFAYVADVTEEQERYLAYGLVCVFQNCMIETLPCIRNSLQCEVYVSLIIYL